MGQTADLVGFAAGLRYADLPGEVVAKAKDLFVNGTFAHGFELDDNHGRSGIKGGCVTVPAGLAVGELMLSSGTEFITALVAAYEVMLRVGVAARAGIVGRGHQPTATCGG
jgi:2-methylcitrate dehydratase PrpD